MELFEWIIDFKPLECVDYLALLRLGIKKKNIKGKAVNKFQDDTVFHRSQIHRDEEIIGGECMNDNWGHGF